MAETEVKTKLTLDDAAAKGLDKLKEGFEEVDEERKETQSGFAKFARDVAVVSIGSNISSMVRGIVDASTAMFTLASAAHDTEQGFAGLIAGIQGVPWKEARDDAEELYEQLTDISIALGQNRDDIIAGHSAMVTFLGGTKEAFAYANEQIEAMSLVANVTGFSVQEIGSQIGKMAAGFVATSGAMFNLLKPTGIFSDDLTKITVEWQKLTDEERLQRLEGAIQGVADNLKEAAPTFSDLATSMKEVGRTFLEEMGEPILMMVIPALEAVREQLVSGEQEFEEFARTIGRDVGRWVVDAIELMEEGFQYIRTHHEEIKEAIVSAFDHAKSVVMFILDHKEEIAMAFGAMAATPVIGAVSRGVSAVAGMATGGGAMALGTAGMATAAVAAVALGAAIGGIALAADQASKLLAETQGGMNRAEQDFDSIQRKLQEIAKSPAFKEMDMDAFKKMAGTLREFAIVTHESPVAARELAASAISAQKEASMIASMMNEAKAAIEAGVTDEETMEQMGLVGAAFIDAMESGNVGAQKYIAGMLADSEQLQLSFIWASDLTAEGFDKLASLVKEQASEFAEDLTNYRKDTFGAAKGAVPKRAPIQMNGGQTFKITQDFRDQDPDRVVAVFQADLSAAAEKRLQPRSAGPFGT